MIRLLIFSIGIVFTLLGLIIMWVSERKQEKLLKKCEKLLKSIFKPKKEG